MAFAALDVVRLATGAGVLAFASYTDWAWRRAPDALWVLAAGVGAVLLLAQEVQEPGLLLSSWALLLASAAFAAMMYAFWWLGLIAGGADAKALMALALLLPLPLHLGAFPLRPGVLPACWAVLGDALLAFLAVPLGLLLVNAARRDLRWPLALLGVRKPREEARRKHYWPMEYVKDGEVRTMLMPSRFEWEDEDWDALAKAGKEAVWVTPKVPFMVPLLAGFVLAFFAGDLLGGLVALVV